MSNRDDQIEKAVENLIDSWDMNTLINFAIEDRIDRLIKEYKEDRINYYLHDADDDEIESLIEEFGGDNVSH